MPWQGVVEWRDAGDGLLASSNGDIVSLRRGIHMLAKTPNNRGYLSSSRGFVHRIVAAAFGIDTSRDIDHINGDKTDNRITNLRACSRGMNMGNTNGQRRRSQRFKGVTAHHRRFIARIRINKKDFHIGSYKTDTEAALAYNEAAQKAFGRFAKLNDVNHA